MVQQAGRATIAIDGPAGAGKSTVARLVAQRLGYVYVDTGAMYRAFTLAVLRADVDPEAVETVASLADETTVTLTQGPEGNRVFLNEEDVTDEIRTSRVSGAVSHVAANPAVRDRLVALQRQLGADGGVVMDGRDIGTVVFPDADLKIFLNASVEERARRRWEQLRAEGSVSPLVEIRANIERRDAIDASREVAPLRKAADAVEVDTTNKSIDRVVQAIYDLAKVKEGQCCTT